MKTEPPGIDAQGVNELAKVLLNAIMKNKDKGPRSQRPKRVNKPRPPVEKPNCSTCGLDHWKHECTTVVDGTQRLLETLAADFCPNCDKKHKKPCFRPSQCSTCGENAVVKHNQKNCYKL